MDFKIVWTLHSREDLRDIATFIAKDNPPAALKLGKQIFDRVGTLEKFPELGRVVPEIGEPTVREVVHRAYRIIYEIFSAEQTVYVLRFWHGARGEPEIKS